MERGPNDEKKALVIVLCLGLLWLGFWQGPQLIEKIDRALHPPSDHPNVILLLLDTVRYDVCGWHGLWAGESPTPVLDSLSVSGLSYLECQAQSSWTLPSMASIFTGVSERSHRAGSRGGFFFGVAEEYETLPELLRDQGFDSYAVFNVPVMDEPFGFWQGYDDVYPYVTQGARECLDADTVVKLGLEWLDAREDDVDPFFLTLHFFDAHYPYDPPLPYWSAVGVEHPVGVFSAATIDEMLELVRDSLLPPMDVELLSRLYVGEVMFMDAQIGRLCAGLRLRGLAENTIIVAIADHGEEFMEHGMLFHGRQLYQETVHVPWIITGPGVPEGLRALNPVGQYDLLPTVMSLLGCPWPSYVEGLPALPDSTAHPFLPTSGDITGSLEQVAIRVGDVKVFWNPEQDFNIAYYVGEGMIEHPDNIMVIDSLVYEDAEFYAATPVCFQPLYVPEGDARAERLRDLGYIR